MSKVRGLEDWDLKEIPVSEQLADVRVLIKYPAVSEELVRLLPKERLRRVNEIHAERATAITGGGLLAESQLFKRGRRVVGVSGSVRLVDLDSLAELEIVECIEILKTNGRPRKKRTPRKRLGLFCVKSTVAIQVEGQTTVRQTYEQRYVLHLAYDEKDALRKNAMAAEHYAKPYLNSSGGLVRWELESTDDVYEVNSTNGWRDLRGPEGLEVFSILQRRKLTPDRILGWQHYEK